MNHDAVDIFTREIIKNSLVAIGEEMFVAMQRTSMSPIIYETLDFGIGITDAKARLIAQGNGIPGFIGTLDGAVADAIRKFGDSIFAGDIFITNTPYNGGGTHLSDVTLCKPVFSGDEIVAWTACKAHWTEVGGMDPGSFTTRSTEVYQEGLQFPLIKLFDRGEINEALLELVQANVRLPDMTTGDLWASAAALNVGERRFLAMIDKYGKDTVRAAVENLLDDGEQIVKAKFAELPKGVFEAEDVIDDDGLGNGPFFVRVKVTISDDEFIADFTGTSESCPGSVNCTWPVLQSSAREIFMGVVDPGVPATEGCFRALKVICPPNTLLTAQRPAPTSSYFESMAVAGDTIRKALAPVMPGRMTAGQMGSVCSMVLNGRHPQNGEEFLLVEPLVGGWGAGANKDGESGQFCVGNGDTANVPVEIQEVRYGVQVEHYGFHNNPGGAGEFRGGKGVLLEYRVLADGSFISSFFGRGKTPPWGINGGEDGTCNYAEIVSGDAPVRRISMASRVALKKGDLVRIFTATGGGWGKATDRLREAIERDLRDGYISEEEARTGYGYNCQENLQ